MKKSLLLILLPFIFVTFASYILSEKACENALKASPERGLPFNHASHTQDHKIECERCHNYYANGRFKGIPNVGTCVTPDCHDRKAKPWFNKYKDEDVPWGAHAEQPDLVFFSHKVVMTAKFDDGRPKALCVNCHGDKSKTSSGEMLKGKMLMGECEDCHRTLFISNDCAVCHD